MKILLVNKFWYLKGGSERYVFLLKDLLEAQGHEVVPFAMQDERNLATPWAKYFAPHVDFWKEGEGDAHASAFGKLASVFWNRRAAAALDGLLKEWKPDVAHLHNFAHQLSPSILPVLKRHGVPVVWTLHDYKILCPNYRMYTKGLPCERCKGHSYANAVRYNCMGSFGASASVAAEMYFHHALTNVYGDHVGAVIAPSAFLAGKLGEWGWEGRVEVVPNFLDASATERVLSRNTPTVLNGDLRSVGDPRSVPPAPPHAPVLFVGRLVEEKGVEDVVEAAKLLPDIPFEVIGDGPMRISNFKSQISNLVWRGALASGEVQRRLAGAAMVVVPSRWYENAPYSVLEAMAAGVPIIAARIGGLPELVRNGVTGTLVPSRDPQALANAIRILYDDPSLRERYGRAAQQVIQEEYGPERHYERMHSIYRSLLGSGT